MADDHTNTPTVKFNVGGKAFETSRSLILQHEGTFLAFLVSEWQMDHTKPIFIDRNGTTFDFVLDYLRYGRITLPMTVSKEMFLLDMDFYGIAHEEGTVKTSTNELAVQVSGQVSNRLDDIVTGVNDIRLVAVNVASSYVGNYSSSKEWRANNMDTGRKIRALKSRLYSP